MVHCGPLYGVKPSLVLLAQLTGEPVLPILYEFSCAWWLRSGERSLVPKPFSTVRFVAGEPHPVARISTPEAFEAAMLAIVKEG